MLKSSRWVGGVGGWVGGVGGPQDYCVSPSPLRPFWALLGLELGWTGLGLGLRGLGTQGLGTRALQ